MQVISIGIPGPVPAQENPKPLPQPRDMVLLHFCFDQQAGEQKKQSCTCKQRVNRDDARQLVRENRADWLIVKNARAKTGTSLFPRALVVRRVIIGGKILFSVAQVVKPDRRSVKHEAIKAGIRTRARKILPGMAAISDSELDRLFQPGPNEEFLAGLAERGQGSLGQEMIELTEHWWNNILGFHRLDSDSGKFMTKADRGIGAIIYEHETPGGDLSKIADASAASGGHGHRVAVANHRASFWSGSWDYSTGAHPHLYQERETQLKESKIEEGLREIGIWSGGKPRRPR